MSQKHGSQKQPAARQTPPVGKNGPKGIPFDFLKDFDAREPAPPPPFVVSVRGRYLPVDAYRPDFGDILVTA